MAELANGSKVGGFIIWHQGNDGAGSGLDADLLDGLDSSDFVKKAGDTMTGRLQFGAGQDIGKDTVSGTTPSQGIRFSGDTDIFDLFLRTDNTGEKSGLILALGDNSDDYFQIEQVSPSGEATPTRLFKISETEGANFYAALKVNGTLDVTGTTSLSAPLTVDGGAGALTLKPGSSDHVYIQFFADTQATNTRSAYVGFGSAGNATFTINNEMANGNINLITNGTGIVTINGNKVWHAGNDGVGSGLDADMLDGLHASQFMRSDGNTSTSGNLSVGGTLTVTGVVKLSKMTYQVTFAPGETTKTITHNLGTTNYMCAVGANSVARHVAWANKSNNTIDIIIDSPYYDENIVVDVILMAY